MHLMQDDIFLQGMLSVGGGYLVLNKEIDATMKLRFFSTKSRYSAGRDIAMTVRLIVEQRFDFGQRAAREWPRSRQRRQRTFWPSRDREALLRLGLFWMPTMRDIHHGSTKPDDR
jgi:hypothetical protein